MELRQLRKLAGLTQQELAKLCVGISNTQLSLAERGLKLHPEEEHAIREVLLRVIASRSAQIDSVLSREAVAV